MFGIGSASVAVSDAVGNRDVENGAESGAIKLCTEYTSNIYFPLCIGACALVGVGFFVFSEFYDY